MSCVKVAGLCRFLARLNTQLRIMAGAKSKGKRCVETMVPSPYEKLWWGLLYYFLGIWVGVFVEIVGQKAFSIR